MEVYVLDNNFRTIYAIDTFTSLIWTERYNGAGDFELYAKVSESLLDLAKSIRVKMASGYDSYVYLPETKNTMFIENVEITTNIEDGNNIIFSGRGLESILSRRVVWSRTVLTGNFQNGIKKLLTGSIINNGSSGSFRIIGNFFFKESTDSKIKALTIDGEYLGENIYDLVVKMCDVYQIGFDVTLNENNCFIFELKNGEVRTYDQNKNTYVVFSPKYENLINSDYIESQKTLMTAALIEGEEEKAKTETKFVTYKYLTESSWTESHSGYSYYFYLHESTKTYFSNNAGVHSSTARSTFTCTPTSPSKVCIRYGVSSEANYDKLTIIFNDDTKVSNISGTNSGSFEAELKTNQNNTLIAIYTKDSSANSGNDNGYFEFVSKPDEVIESTITTAGFRRTTDVERYPYEQRRTGLSRRELYVNASDISITNEDGSSRTDSEYYKLLKQRGYETLYENNYTKAFSGEVDAKKTFIYGKDFFIGDIVQVENEYKMETKVRVTEFVISQDQNGYRTYPTFELLDE